MQNELLSEEILRYSQHIKLSEIGLSGQKKFKSARVLIVGLGGLGSPIVLYLAAAGIGTLGIVDPDTVELTNLQRQILYRMQYIGKSKTTSAEEQILALNPAINVHSYAEKLTVHNADTLISQYDIIADGSDNFATHYLIHDTCFKYNKPYVHASAGQFQGYSSVFHADHQNPCLRCLFPLPPAQTIPNCATEGVLSVLPGLLGIIQATEIIKCLLNRGDALIKRLLVVDLLKMTFKTIQLRKNPNCKLCVKHELTQESLLINSNRHDNALESYALSAQQFIQLLQKPNVSLVDVRSEAEHKSRNIGGQLIPLEELPQRLNELNRQHIIILYCLSGKRSQSAVEMLIAAGFHAVNYLYAGAGEFF
ncbi:MAG: HesA/MoeB/ThiF family protein [Candidatus Aquirickettsiella sp.]